MAHPWRTIAEGIADPTAAGLGDTVWVADGTYYEYNLICDDKAIAIRSISDNPESCIVDGGANGRIFTFFNNNSDDAVLRGFTIQNGYNPSYDGGGIYIVRVSPTITNCIFSGNVARSGGGMYIERSYSFITGCQFSNNQAVNQGGGICVYMGQPNFIDCSMNGNSAGGFGGGIHVFMGSSDLDKCIITSNTAYDGGGLSINLGGLTAHNCLISENQAIRNGGGIHNRYAYSSTLINCTISRNISGNLGGGAYFDYEGAPQYINCIFWGDTADGTANEMDIYGEDPVAENCDIQGSIPAGLNAISCFSSDPMFLAGIPYDYHIAQSSLCIDMGKNEGAPVDDIDGDFRPYGIVDVGFDELVYSPGDSCAQARILPCNASYNDLETTGFSDTALESAACGYSGVDIWFQIDTSALVIGEIITASITDENISPGDFQISMLNGCDSDLNCLVTDSSSVEVAYASGDLYLVIDGGEGTLDLQVSCVITTPVPTPSPTPVPSVPSTSSTGILFTISLFSVALLLIVKRYD